MVTMCNVLTQLARMCAGPTSRLETNCRWVSLGQRALGDSSAPAVVWSPRLTG